MNIYIHSYDICDNSKHPDHRDNSQQVVKQDPSTHGRFYSGDSYIVLNTYEVEGKKLYNVHFWLGSETTQDEMGTAAYKTVELDDLLGRYIYIYILSIYIHKRGGYRVLIYLNNIS